MANPRKMKIDPAPSRVAARPQAERRVDAGRDVIASSTGGPSFDDVSQRAFEIWDRTGRLPGRDVENWLQAEAELRSR